MTKLWELSHGPLARYVKLRMAHAPGMPGTFSPPPQVSDPDMRHGTCVTHVPWCMSGSLTSGFLWIRWRGKRSRHSRRMRNPQFYASGKRPILHVQHVPYVWNYTVRITPSVSKELDIHLPRQDRRGGGVGLLYRDSYKAKRVKIEKFSSFEHQTVSLSCGTVTCVYLNSGLFTQDFSSQFSELISFLQTKSAKHLIVGDFNFHVNIDTDVDAKKLKSLLEQFDLVQHVNIPTHTAGNTLDLVISKGDILVKDIRTDLSVSSDHFAVLFTLSSPSPGLPKQTVSYRSWRSVDHDKLRKDIGDAFSNFTCSDVESALHHYNEVLQNIVDTHAPEKTRVVTIRPEASWYNSKLAEEKRLKRKYERRYITKADLPLIGNFTVISGRNIITCWIQPNRNTLKIK